MASIAPLVLNDGQTPPVSRTFSPVKAAMDTAVWRDRTSGILTGMPSIQISSRLPVKGSSLFKVKATMKIPVMEVVSNATINGIAPSPTIAYTCQVNVELLLPERSSLQDRKDIQILTANLLANNQMSSLVQNFESPY